MPRAVDTIYAPATGTGAAAICVIRLSGPRAHEALRILTARDLPPPRSLVRRWILDRSGERVDDALVVTFPEGASFTGEPMAEIQCHGSRAVVMAICDRLAVEPGCRLAEPGEFARRAFEADRLGLSEAEGLADLIAAETEVQRRQAMRIMSGELSGKVERWRTDLLRACALLELTIDWVDEDIPHDVMPEVRAILDRLSVDLADELRRSRTAQRVRSGFEVAIVGAPNAGKSSLLNHLAGREAAIVSTIPGTTRDVIEVRYDLRGLPVVFLDTAGIREASDPVERMGVARAIERARQADLRIHLSAPDVVEDAGEPGLHAEGDLRVQSKSDLGAPGAGLPISVKTGEGIEKLLARLHDLLAERVGSAGLLSHLRHEQAVATCAQRLRDVLTILDHADAEIAADRLRFAAESLELLVGRIDAEAVLDVVFGSFCLGK